MVLHPFTQQQLNSFIAKPSHAVALIGPTGSGKVFLAEYLAAKVLALRPEDFAAYPYKKLVSPASGKALGIEAIRQIEHFLALKVPRQARFNRAVIIEAAQLLTQEAQNALL